MTKSPSNRRTRLSDDDQANASNSDDEDDEMYESEYEEEELYFLVECDDFEHVNIFSPFNAFKDFEEKSIIERETELRLDSSHREISLEMISNSLPTVGQL